MIRGRVAVEELKCFGVSYLLRGHGFLLGFAPCLTLTQDSVSCLYVIVNLFHVYQEKVFGKDLPWYMRNSSKM